MEKTPSGPFDPCPASPPRFSLGGGAGKKLAACLWLWTGVGALAAVAPDALPPSPYRQALTSFEQRRDAQALTWLDQVPLDGNPAARADALNLRGAVLLRQGRFEQARAAFAEAVQADPALWAARYNEAEVTFREGRYAASHAQFDALLDRTSRVFHADERRFLEYKLLLTELCAGQEQSTLDFLAAHRTDSSPPLAWYYLNAALQQRHGQPQKADEFLAQTEGKRAPGNHDLYAESLPRAASRTGQTADRHRATRRVSAPEGAAVASVGAEEGRSARRPSPVRPTAATTLAVVQLLPDRSKESAPESRPASASPDLPEFRTGEPPAASEGGEAGNLPPTGQGLFPAQDSAPVAPAAAPAVLAKPRRARGSATPTPTPTATPDGVTANQEGASTPTASATPTASPVEEANGTPTPAPASSEFTQQYEDAYAKFLQKDYAGCLNALAEADKIQPHRPESTTLRKQVFKLDYEAAYLAFRKLDFPVALSKLDEADQAQPNFPDALNLRGLVYSKQHSYDKAEAMFKKAVEADPTLWAAKFNYAELPFNRGDYTTARGRFEDLLAETDATKRAREAELTEYKVFLTLLMEGKTDQARSFMDRFNFSGATPAKYFCNAAMNFRAGTVDKAEDWINSAKREYPAQLVSIFLESFYRLGWMTDPNTPGVGTLASATPTPSPAGSPAVEAVTTSVPASPAPAKVAVLTPAPSPAASATPTLLAASAPTATPLAATLGPVASPAETVAPVPTAAEVVSAVTPTGSVPPPPPSPAATPPAANSPEETAALRTPSAAELKKAESAASGDFLRWCLVGGVLLYALYVVAKVLAKVKRRQARRNLARALAQDNRDAVVESDQVKPSL